VPSLPTLGMRASLAPPALRWVHHVERTSGQITREGLVRELSGADVRVSFDEIDNLLWSPGVKPPMKIGPHHRLLVVNPSAAIGNSEAGSRTMGTGLWPGWS
jgi:hypothetical protein